MCPERRKSGRNGLPRMVRRLRARFARRKCNSRFQEGAHSAAIRAEFGSYLGNVGKHATCNIRGLFRQIHTRFSPSVPLRRLFRKGAAANRLARKSPPGLGLRRQDKTPGDWLENRRLRVSKV